MNSRVIFSDNKYLISERFPEYRYSYRYIVYKKVNMNNLSRSIGFLQEIYRSWYFTKKLKSFFKD